MSLFFFAAGTGGGVEDFSFVDDRVVRVVAGGAVISVSGVDRTFAFAAVFALAVIVLRARVGAATAMVSPISSSTAAVRRVRFGAAVAGALALRFGGIARC
jgi:hypothetical protein